MSGHTFMRDLADRLANRIQLNSDGHKLYLDAVERAFGHDIDTRCGEAVRTSSRRAAGALQPGTVVGTVKGSPATWHVSSSYAERQNLSMRMGMRRFTRLTIGFSKKAENHAHALAIYFMHYNFVRIHQSLRVTPAMAAKVTERL